MTPDIWLVFGVLAATIILFALDKFRLDLIALLALLSLLMTGILSPAEALAGFANPVVVMIAGLFVVGGALFETGVADAAGRWLGRAAGLNKPRRLLVLIMLSSALLSAFLSSTGTVAVMLPVVVSLARRSGISPSKLLLPLAFSSLLGGMLTLIGTPPNIVVSNQLQSQGLEPFNFFAFTPVGLVMLSVGIGFMLTLGGRLLPERGPLKPESSAGASRSDLIKAYDLEQQLWNLRLLANSGGVGKTLADLGIRSRYSVNVLSIDTVAKRRHSRRAEPDSMLRVGDTLLVKGDRRNVERFAREHDMLILQGHPLLPENLRFAELIVPPRSKLLGQSARDGHLRERYGCAVLAVERGKTLITDEASFLSLNVGDTLLVMGGRRALTQLKHADDFIVVSEPGDLQEKPLSPRAPFILAILGIMLALMTFGIVANVTAVLLAAVGVVLVGGLNMDSAYRNLNPESVVLIAAVLPLATALEKTGALDLIVAGLLGGLGAASPYLVLLALFLLTSLLSQVISNTATTVLVAPVAFSLALELGLSPYPLLMTVAVAASTAFMTPVASPVNALVINPGRYHFSDFVKVGAALQVLILLATLAVVPLVFPF